MAYDSTEVVADSASKTVLKAARELIQKGWCQGQLQRGNRYCIVGAIEASSDPAEYCNPYLALGKVLNIHACGLGSWNDAPERTQADVLDLFDRAIELS